MTRLQWSRAWLWAGLLSPMLVSVSRSVEDVESLQLGLADALRAGLPVLGLVVGYLLARPVHRLRAALPWLLAGFIGWSALSSLWSAQPQATFLKTVVLAVQYVLLFALASRYESTARMVRDIVGVAHLLILSVWVGLVVAPGLALQPVAGGASRLAGVWPPLQPNVLGLIALIVIAGLLLRVGPAWTLRPAVSVLLGSATITALVMARTRLALAVIAACVVWIVLKLIARDAFYLVVPLFGLPVLGLAVMAYGGTVIEFLQRGQTASQLTSLTGRLPLWDNALALYERQPWEGFGYYSGHRLVVDPVAGSGYATNIDNMWIELLVDVGRLGTALMAAAVLAGLWAVYRLRADWGTRAFLTVTAVSFATATFFNPSLQIVAFIGAFFGLLLTAALIDGSTELPDGGLVVEPGGVESGIVGGTEREQRDLGAGGGGRGREDVAKPHPGL